MCLNEPMSKHTSWRVGGVVDRLYKPTNVEDLSQFLLTLSLDEPVYWVGLGSNLLVRDGGIRGTVIKTAGLLAGMRQLDGRCVYAESGVSCAKVARFAANENLQDAEFLVGIPGTVGGALAMNAGAFGGETWDIVQAVKTIDRQGQVTTRAAGEFSIGYRSVQMPESEWFIAAYFDLSKGDKATSLAAMKQLLRDRAKTQPLQLPSCGSVFRNPGHDHAARLIEASGLKGMCIGGACVSEKHANFIVNTGVAKASDIEKLIDKFKQTVLQQQGVTLQREVRIVGEY